MENNRRYLIAYALVTALFILLTILYLPAGIVLQFNVSGEDPFVLSKYLIIVLVLLSSYFIGVQLNDEKNKGDYTRWYIVAGIIVAIEAWILISNL